MTGNVGNSHGILPRKPITQYSQYPDTDTNPEPPEYKAGLLTI
jgi:hypothetical protein